EYVRTHRDELLQAAWKEASALLVVKGDSGTSRPGLSGHTVVPKPDSSPKPTGSAAKPSRDEQVQQAIKRFMATEEARAVRNKEDDVKAGKTDTAYKFEWPVPPHVEGDFVVFASVMYQKRDAQSDWFGIGYAGDAQNPCKIAIGSFISQWGK
ncbi:MAG TPA: hypothetical protein PKO06_22410, partial [Candidatus Ozemobacteraceae bacterium]|nr:hypothetical protein [Candidatus Ozemobacteraceae bacterium]